MELPRLIVVGEKNISEFGKFLRSLNNPKKLSLVSGIHVKKFIQKKIEDALTLSKIRYVWHIAKNNEISSIKEIEKNVKKDNSDLIIGIGGGRSVDIAKMIAFNLKKSFVSLPTAASHDGIASPFVSIRGDKPGEYFGKYSANLASMSAKILMENSDVYAKKGLDVRVIVEALISAGVASCIAGSSRPCSGSEHLFSHALDRLAPGVGLHGEKCGLGAIMMAKLQGQDWKKIVKTLKNLGAPTTAKEIGLKPETLAKAMTIAQDLRPERYTILKEVNMTPKKAIALAKSTKVL